VPNIGRPKEERRDMLALLVALRAVPTPERRPWWELNLLGPQDDEEDACRDGCTKQKFCIHPPEQDSATPDEVGPLANGWGISYKFNTPKAKGKSCKLPSGLEAMLCADEKGEYCQVNAKEEAEEGEEWTYEKALGPGQCVGIDKSATDWFCAKMCNPVSKCKKSKICQCGPDPSEIAAPPSPPEWVCDDSTWDPKDPPCISRDGQADYWCHTTCTSCKRYQQMNNVCICGPVAAEKVAARKEIAKHSCDLDVLACYSAAGGAQDCRSCADHISNCRLAPHRDKNGTALNFKLDDCLDFVATNIKDCKRCNKDRSKEAYKVRVGLVWEYGEAPEDLVPQPEEDWTKTGHGGPVDSRADAEADAREDSLASQWKDLDHLDPSKNWKPLERTSLDPESGGRS